ncbi:MAG TPA: hypothetical protein VL688_12960 [Verrucomicrobiae bacterium]|nr:hypothetical protein [Verrucomicrobiae bacterium]
MNTEADPETLSGEFSAQAEWKDRTLEIKIFKEKKPAGSVLLELPGEWSFFQAEAGALHAKQGAPRMYKEIRLEGKLQAAGALALKNILNPGFRLIFQGVGGRCFEPGDFNRWILQVNGLDPENPSLKQRMTYYSMRGSFSPGTTVSKKRSKAS